MKVRAGYAVLVLLTLFLFIFSGILVLRILSLAPSRPVEPVPPAAPIAPIARIPVRDERSVEVDVVIETGDGDDVPVVPVRRPATVPAIVVPLPGEPIIPTVCIGYGAAISTRHAYPGPVTYRAVPAPHEVLFYLYLDEPAATEKDD